MIINNGKYKVNQDENLYTIINDRKNNGFIKIQSVEAILLTEIIKLLKNQKLSVK